MRLTRAHIDGFGILVEEDFEFAPALNVVYGPNEAGKTTLQQALLALLHGFYSGERVAPQEKQHHVRFRPWSGTSYGGKLYLRLDSGATYLISRRFDSPEPETQIFDTTTGRDITNQFVRKRRGYVDFCERQLGMSRGVFESIACVRQGQLALISEGEAQAITDTIIRLVDSAPADISVRTVLDRLMTAIRSIGTERSRSGPIFRARQVLAKNTQRLEKRQELATTLENDYARRQELMRRVEALGQAEHDLETQLKITKYRALKSLQRKLSDIERQRQEVQERLHQMDAQPLISPQDRDQLLKSLEELRLMRRQRTELFDDLRRIEQSRDASRQELEKIPVPQEVWRSGQDREFFPIKKEWEDLQGKAEEARAEQKKLEQDLHKAGISREVFKMLQALDDRQLDVIRKADIAASETQENVESIDEEIRRQGLWTKIARSGLGGLAGLMLLIALLAGFMPTSIFAAFIGLFSKAAFTSILLSIVALYVVLELTFTYNTSQLQDRRQKELNTQRIAHRDLMEQLAPYKVTTFNDLEYHKYTHDEVRKRHSQASRFTQRIEDVQKKLQFWLEKFGVQSPSLEEMNIIAERLQMGRHQWENIQKLSVRIEAMDADVRRLDERLDAVSTRIHQLLEAAQCWSGNIESDAAHYLALAEQTQQHHALARELEQLNAREAELREGRAGGSVAEQLEQLEAELGSQLSKPDLQPYNELVDGLQRKRAEKQKLQIELAGLNERILQQESQLPNVSELEEEIAAAEQEITELVKKRQALELAAETLRDAAQKAHRDFAPRLAQNVGRYIGNLTHNRYDEVYIDPEDFNMKVAHGRAKTLVPLDFLSFGTQEQIYLLMRAAIAQLFSSSAESVLLFLDDPLAHADDKRQVDALRLIWELSRNQQVFYFTKDKNILDNLEQLKADFNYIPLQPARERVALR